MVYSEVIENEWHKILPKKVKYTKHDMNKVLIASLFDPSINNGNTFSFLQARFITVCTAIYYDAKCSKYLMNYNSNNRRLKL